MAFTKGDRYKHYVRKTPRGTALKKPAVRECTIVQDCQRHVTVDYGNYRGTILKASMFTGEEWMEKVS